MKLRNTDERYGDSTVFESDSRAAAADEMATQLRQWALEEDARKRDDHAHSGDTSAYDGPSVDAILARLRVEFIAGLEEVE